MKKKTTNDDRGDAAGSGITPSARTEADPGALRPLLEPAFLLELERLCAPERRAAPTKTRRRKPDARRPLLRLVRTLKPAQKAASEESSPLPGNSLANSVVPPQRAMTQVFRRLFRGQHSHLYIILDCTESMEMRSGATRSRKWDQASRLAAAIGIASRPHYENVCLVGLCSARGRRAPVLRNDLDRSGTIFSSLRQLRPGGKGRILTVVNRLIRRAPRGSTFVILSDLMSPEWEDAVAMLFDSELSTALIQILDPNDLAREPHAAPLFLKDGSGEQARPVGIDRAVLNSLRDTVNHFCAELSDRCRAAGAAYCRTHTDEIFEQALLKALGA